MTPKENTSLVWPISSVMVNLSACNQSKLSVIQTNQSQSQNYALDSFTSKCQEKKFMWICNFIPLIYFAS